MNVPAAKTIFSFYCLFIIAAVMIVLSSCVTNYPRQPFVYKTNINILPKGKFSAEEEKILYDQLNQQLHDSVRVRRVSKFLVAKVLNNPPVFDSVNVSISQRYMEVMLHTLGYLRDSIHSSDTIIKVNDQLRTTINFDVYPNQLFKLDSIAYNLFDSVPYLKNIDTLQKLITQTSGQRLLRKGNPFSQYLISSELDRITDLAKNNGYLLFTKEQLLAVWDTVGKSILTATTDIGEQLRQLQKLQERRQNPTADLEIRLRPNPDSSKLIRYRIGQVTIYPDTDIDTTQNERHKADTTFLTRNQYRFISYHNLFKPKKILSFITLQKGDLYRQKEYQKTFSKLSTPAAWRLVTVTPIPRKNTDTVDFEISLVPQKQYRVEYGADISKNQGNIAAASNLIGLGANLIFLNKNFAKSASVATTNIRYGIELSSKIGNIQTQQITLGNTIQFPRLVPWSRQLPKDWRENAQTFLSANLGYTDRLSYYRVVTLNTSWGYQFNVGKSIWNIRFPNIEYNFLERRDSLIELIKHNRSYQYIFNDGFILSAIINWNNIETKKNYSRSIRTSIEPSGFPGFIHEIFPNSKLYRFIKLDGEYSQLYKIGARKRSALAWRFFGGIGYGLPFANPNGSKDSLNLFMPFFRSYYAGGPNSMRAWSLRKLGPGSTIKSFNATEAPDRFGDMRLELNAEWRIYITQFLGAYPMETALFTDIGNVWFVRQNKDFPDGNFQIRKLWKDLAIGTGTGLRIDFGFLLARFDFAWKAKDPSPDDPAAQNKWFYHWNLGFSNRYGTQFQLGINYPF